MAGITKKTCFIIWLFINIKNLSRERDLDRVIQVPEKRRIGLTNEVQENVMKRNRSRTLGQCPYQCYSEDKRSKTNLVFFIDKSN